MAVGEIEAGGRQDAFRQMEERGLKPQQSFKECSVCPEMVFVPPGDPGGEDSDPRSFRNEACDQFQA